MKFSMLTGPILPNEIYIFSLFQQPLSKRVNPLIEGAIAISSAILIWILEANSLSETRLKHARFAR